MAMRASYIAALTRAALLRLQIALYCAGDIVDQGSNNDNDNSDQHEDCSLRSHGAVSHENTF